MRAHLSGWSFAAFPLLGLLMACGAGVVVEAGDDQEILLGATAQFEAMTAETDGLTYRWSVLQRPDGSSASLDADGPRVQVTPEAPGLYTLQVTASRAAAEGHDTVTLTVLPNLRPIADAGSDRLVPVGETVELDGRGSRDPDGQELDFRWTIVERPDGSEAQLSSSTSRTPRFVADRGGRFVVELEVHDGGYTAADRVTIVTNSAPLAAAGPNLTGTVGQPVALDGSGSSDLDDDPLTFEWAFLSVPDGSTAALVDPLTAHAGFTPDLPGSYLVDLRVSDGHAVGTSRLNVQVLPVGGIASSVVYVSPTGDDDNPGTAALPLATFEAALLKVVSTEQIYRIQLSAGTWSEAFNHQIQDQTVEILGPEEGVAKLVGPSTLFELRGTSRMLLSRVSLEAGGTALIGRGAATHIGLNEVDCAAKSCVQSGQFLSFSGGSVEVRDSRITGNGEGTGVSAALGQLSISGSEIRGHAFGIAAVNARLIARDTLLETISTGVSIFANTDPAIILLQNLAVSDCEVGVQALAAPLIRIIASGFSGCDKGVDVSGGTLRMEAVTMSNMQLGVSVGGIANTGEVVTVRNAVFSSFAGPAFVVNHSKSVLDLGYELEAGNNQLSSSLGLAVWDKRPAGASGSITLSLTTLNGQAIPAGTYTGPHNEGAFTIVGAGNMIYVD